MMQNFNELNDKTEIVYPLVLNTIAEEAIWTLRLNVIYGEPTMGGHRLMLRPIITDSLEMVVVALTTELD